MRIIKSAKDFFDILESIPDNRWISIGYVMGANLDIPKIKRKNPVTNRMKGYPDYSAFEGGSDIGALVAITSYNFRFRHRNVINKTYRDVIVPKKNAIRAEYGIDSVQGKEDYKQANAYGNGNSASYVGANEKLAGHSYMPQNTYNAKKKTMYYAIGTDGHILRPLTPDEVRPYMAKKKAFEGESALRKMGVEEERIQEYIKKIKDLGFTYKNFEFSSILWLCATVDGEPIIYINDNLARAVDDIDIRPEDFRKIARERYNIELNQLGESLKRKKTLTEAVIGKALRESINKLFARNLFI